MKSLRWVRWQGAPSADDDTISLAIFLAGKTANERETGLDSEDIREARLVDPNTGQPIELAEDDQAHYEAETSSRRCNSRARSGDCGGFLAPPGSYRKPAPKDRGFLCARPPRRRGRDRPQQSLYRVVSKAECASGQLLRLQVHGGGRRLEADPLVQRRAAQPPHRDHCRPAVDWRRRSRHPQYRVQPLHPSPCAASPPATASRIRRLPPTS